MISFGKEIIDNWREQLRKRGYHEETASLDGRSIDYFVMPTKLFQGIPNGLFRMTGKPEDGYLIGVSEQVPDEIKPHFALSEHDEFIIYGLDDKDRTLKSESNMVRILNGGSLLPVYAQNKIILYDYIIRNSANDLKSWGFTNEDYDGFFRALGFLKGLNLR